MPVALVLPTLPPVALPPVPVPVPVALLSAVWVWLPLLPPVAAEVPPVPPVTSPTVAPATSMLIEGVVPLPEPLPRPTT